MKENKNELEGYFGTKSSSVQTDIYIYIKKTEYAACNEKVGGKSFKPSQRHLLRGQSIFCLNRGPHEMSVLFIDHELIALLNTSSDTVMS